MHMDKDGNRKPGDVYEKTAKNAKSEQLHIFEQHLVVIFFVHAIDVCV